MADGAALTLRILADASQVTSTFKKVGDEWKVVGDKAVKTTTALGGSIDAMGKRLLSVAAAIGAISAAASIANSLADKFEKRAQEKNAQSVDAAHASLRAGGSQQENALFINQRGENQRTTQGGRTKFMSAIGDLQMDRAARGLPPIKTAQIRQMQDLYDKGGDLVFPENGADIINSAKQFPGQPGVAVGRQLAAMNGTRYHAGQDNMALAGSAYDSANDKAVKLALAQEQLKEMTRRKSMDHTGAGQQFLAGDQLYEQWKLDNPGRSTLGERFMPEANRAAGRAAHQKEGVDLLKEISDKMGNTAGNPVLPNTSTRGRDPNGALTP